jgi:integrase
MTDRRKIGNVTLTTLDEVRGRYEITYYDPARRNTSRRRFFSSSKQQAVEVAKQADRERLQDKGLLPAKKKGLSMEYALIEAIRASGANDRTKHDYAYAAGAFCKWMLETFPGVLYWHELKPKHISAYVQHMSGRNLAGDTIRKRLFPISTTGKYFYNNDGLLDPTRGARLPESRPPAARPVLDESTLISFMAFMRESGPVDLSAVLHLQGLCGLRMLEAINLRECDVDLNAGTVEITDTARHKPKTRSSWRVIPVPGVVVDVLRYAMTSRKVKGPDSLLLPSPRHPARTWEMSGISKALMRCFDRARLSGLNIPAGFIPRKLRASFVTMATRANVRENYLQRYVGHAPESILTKHYTSTTLDDLKREVLQPVIAYLSKIDREGVHHAQS